MKTERNKRILYFRISDKTRKDLEEKRNSYHNYINRLNASMRNDQNISREAFANIEKLHTSLYNLLMSPIEDIENELQEGKDGISYINEQEEKGRHYLNRYLNENRDVMETSNYDEDIRDMLSDYYATLNKALIESRKDNISIQFNEFKKSIEGELDSVNKSIAEAEKINSQKFSEIFEALKKENLEDYIDDRQAMVEKIMDTVEAVVSPKEKALDMIKSHVVPKIVEYYIRNKEEDNS